VSLSYILIFMDIVLLAIFQVVVLASCRYAYNLVHFILFRWSLEIVSVVFE